MSEEITPLRQQYLEIKKQYPDAIVFFRLGDFYETFDEDAYKTSEALDIVLTSRPVAKGVRVPMAGIPFHAVDNYLGRLIEKGYHVAICEQVGGAATERGLFPRDVVRVITPGTVTEPGLLPVGRNNYLVALNVMEGRAGLAYVDISTGEFAGTEIETDPALTQIHAELARLKAAEVLVSDQLELPKTFTDEVTRVPNWYFEPGRAEELIKHQFGVSSLEGFGLKQRPLTVRAAGGLLKYLNETQKGGLPSLTGFNSYSLSDFMVLDGETRRNLELTETLRDNKVEGSLLSVLDKTKSHMGKRTLRSWVNNPLLDRDKIRQRQDLVEYFFTDGVRRTEISTQLKELHDLERLVNRMVSGSARPPDLVGLREDLQLLPELLNLLPTDAHVLKHLRDRIKPFPELSNLLIEAITEDPPATTNNTGIIRAGYSDELDQIVNASAHAREWINNLEATERQRSGIKALRTGYNKVFGYYIEISRGSAAGAPDNYIRKQTLVNAERFITPELKEYESLVLNAESQIHEVELRLFKAVCVQVAAFAPGLLETARALGELDSLISLATVAALNNYVRPLVQAEKGLEITNGRHPVVERFNTLDRFIANDTVFEPGEIIRVITGPNMSGKSTFLRQVVLIVLMAQIGSFVPADTAVIGLVDRVFTRIGAQDAIHAGQSTFMVEMIETANILNHATSRSLLILDEIGRGTSTYDGLSIAWSIIEYLHSHPRLKPFTLFATHYHELIQLADLLPGMRNYNVAVTEGDGRVIFLHKIVPGGSDRSYGIHVAQLAGLPSPVIQRANEILKQLEASAGKTQPDKVSDENQLRLFPENNPLIEAFKKLDLETLSPIQALNLLYEWRATFIKDNPS
jgi:DNA mismatch repair protein MutS